jgi:hypothetical protein
MFGLKASRPLSVCRSMQRLFQEISLQQQQYTDAQPAEKQRVDDQLDRSEAGSLVAAIPDHQPGRDTGDDEQSGQCPDDLHEGCGSGTPGFTLIIRGLAVLLHRNDVILTHFVGATTPSRSRPPIAAKARLRQIRQLMQHAG